MVPDYRSVFLLLVAASGPNFPSPHFARAVGVIAALALLVRLGMIERVWRDADRVYSADLAAIDALPPGSKIAIAHPDLFHVVPIPEVHLALLAIPRREAFVPTLFAIAGQQPVALKPAFAALADAAPPQPLWAILTAAQSAAPAAAPSAVTSAPAVAPSELLATHLAFVDHRLRIGVKQCVVVGRNGFLRGVSPRAQGIG